jgi:hypothetical protein
MLAREAQPQLGGRARKGPDCHIRRRSDDYNLRLGAGRDRPGIRSVTGVAQVGQPDSSVLVCARLGERYRRCWKRGLRSPRFADTSHRRMLPPAPGLVPGPPAHRAEYDPYEIAASVPHGCNYSPAT